MDEVGRVENIQGGVNANPPLIEIKADNVGLTTVTTLLKTFNFCEKANVFVSAAGIRFMVEEGRYVQAGMLFKTELFTAFTHSVESVEFKIPLKELLDCLKILGDTKNSNVPNETSDGVESSVTGGSCRFMQITYCGHGFPFSLSLEETGMRTEIEMRTEEVDFITDYDGNNGAKWDTTMDSRLLHDYLFELEGLSPENITVRVVPDTFLELRATGTGVSLKISIPKNCSGVERFCSAATEESACYKFSILRHSFKLIHASEKVVLEMEDNKVLTIRLIFKETMSTTCQFHVVPLVEDEEENDLAA